MEHITWECVENVTMPQTKSRNIFSSMLAQKKSIVGNVGKFVKATVWTDLHRVTSGFCWSRRRGEK